MLRPPSRASLSIFFAAVLCLNPRGRMRRARRLTTEAGRITTSLAVPAPAPIIAGTSTLTVVARRDSADAGGGLPRSLNDCRTVLGFFFFRDISQLPRNG